MLTDGAKVLMPLVVSDGHDSQNIVMMAGAVVPGSTAPARPVVAHQDHLILADGVELGAKDELARLQRAERENGLLKKQLADVEATLASVTDYSKGKKG